MMFYKFFFLSTPGEFRRADIEIEYRWNSYKDQTSWKWNQGTYDYVIKLLNYCFKHGYFFIIFFFYSVRKLVTFTEM